MLSLIFPKTLIFPFSYRAISCQKFVWEFYSIFPLNYLIKNYADKIEIHSSLRFLFLQSVIFYVQIDNN